MEAPISVGCQSWCKFKFKFCLRFFFPSRLELFVFKPSPTLETRVLSIHVSMLRRSFKRLLRKKSWHWEEEGSPWDQFIEAIILKCTYNKSQLMSHSLFSSSPFYLLSCSGSFNFSCLRRLASQLKLIGQVGSTTDHLSSCCLIHYMEDLSPMRDELI